MKTIHFQLVAAARPESAVFQFSNFNEGSVCDMCWGDLSL